ncbi:hypothetical protein DICA3_B14598 [Diutina catenulata]
MSDPSKRIIGHMNKSHAIALEDYLVVYGNVDNIDDNSAAIKNIDTELVEVEYRSNGEVRTHVIRWNNAPEQENVQVKEMGDLKGKLVSMAKYAAEKRGYSHTRVTKALLPNSPDQIVMYFVFVLAVWRRVNPASFQVTFGSYIAAAVANVPARLLPAAEWIVANGHKIVTAMYWVHLGEVFAVMLPMTRKYRVPLGVKLQWCIMNIIEGFPSWRRFKSLT